MNWAILAVNILCLLRIHGVSKRVKDEARTVRQHVTKALFMHRKLTNDGSQS